jgi:glucose-6-phosphate 1-epimerase
LAGVEVRLGSGHYGVYDHGAHVWAWQPDGRRPVLWLSAKSMLQPGEPIRGGIPVVFPWFGTGPDGDRKPPHGFARLEEWNQLAVRDTTDADGRLVVELQLDQTRTGNQPAFPYSYVADLRVTFTPEYLQVELTITNADRTPFTFEEALHTYLAVSDARQISIEGLDGVEYLDRVAGAHQLNCVQDGVVRITGETDRLYLGHPAVTLNDPGWERTLRITNEGAANLVVWNPWVTKAAGMPDFGDKEWTEMICIEAANALKAAITVAPGEAHVVRQRISLA